MKHIAHATGWALFVLIALMTLPVIFIAGALTPISERLIAYKSNEPWQGI